MTTRPHSPARTGRRHEVLQLLQQMATPVSINEIAQHLGIHANTVRFHLDSLIETGHVERATATPSSPGRPPQMYRAVPGMDPTGPRHYRVLAELFAADLSEKPEPSRRALEAGRTWGRRYAERAAADAPPSSPDTVTQLMGLLDDLGFAPERSPGGDASLIGLRSCPFLELATDRSHVVCPAHLGLMQGAMETWGASVSVDSLQPFVEPDLCLAHMNTGA